MQWKCRLVKEGEEAVHFIGKSGLMRAVVMQGKITEQMFFGFRGLEYPSLLSRLRPGWTVTSPRMCMSRRNTQEDRKFLVFNGPQSGTTILKFVERRPIPESLVRELRMCFVERRHPNEEEQQQFAQHEERPTEPRTEREGDSGQGKRGSDGEAASGEGSDQKQSLSDFLKEKASFKRKRGKPRRNKR